MDNKMDINKAVENPAMVTAINNLLACNTAETRKSFEDELLKVRFLLPVELSEEPTPSKEEGKKTINQGTRISIQMQGDSNGKQLLPVFTDWNELRKWTEKPDSETETFVLGYKNVLSFVKNCGGFVINPRGKYLIVTLSMIDEINKKFKMK